MKSFLIITLVFIVFLILFNFLKSTHNPSVLIDGKTFYVSIARTDDQKAKGLSIYNSLSFEKGMIFPFSTSDYYAFWMKDMKFPIDIIHIQNNKIIDIFENATPPLSDKQQLTIYKPKEKANYVLEINAGLSRKFNFKKGDSVRISL